MSVSNNAALQTDKGPNLFLKAIHLIFGIFKWLGRHWFLSGLVLALAIGYLYWKKNSNNGPTTEPLIVTVSSGDIENTVTAAGSIQPRRFVDVGAQVSGQLEKLHVVVGDEVTEGQLLAEIDPSIQAARVAASEASLDALIAQQSSREASLKLAQANAERQTRLIKEDATSQADFDRAVNDLASAQSSLTQLRAQIVQSKASLTSDKATLGYSKIYAPVAGTIVSISVKEGQTLNASQQSPTILRIADLGTMTVETDVSEADVSKLKPGLEVYFTTLGSGQRRWYGELRQILPTPEITNNVVLYTALFDVDNADGALLSGMTAQVYFVTASARDVVTVPVAALTFERPGGAGAEVAQERGPRQWQGGGPPPGVQGGGSAAGAPGAFAQREGGGQRPDLAGGRPRSATVQVVKADGTFEERKVRIGLSSRVSAHVISGLQPGDKVIAGIVQANTEDDQSRDNMRNRGFRW